MIIPLGNKVRAEVIDSVLGQLSDGIWENSGAMNKYWKFAHVDGTDLDISDDSSDSEIQYGYNFRGRYKTIWNGFYRKSETEIKNWFANKAKQVVKIWAEDEGLDPKEIWSRDCTETVSYMGGHDVPNVTVADVYECYDFLKGRSGKKYGRTYEEPIPEEIAPEDDMYEVEDYVEPDVSGGMNPSQQELEDFFLDASTRTRGRSIKASRRTFTKYPSNYVKATKYPAWCYNSPEEYEAAQDDNDGPVVLSDGMEIADKSEAYTWLRENVEQYGNTYFWDSSLRTDLDRLIERFGSTYFWRS